MASPCHLSQSFPSSASLGAAAGRDDLGSRPTNDSLLKAAAEKQKDTTDNLRRGLEIVENTREIGANAAATLELSREKLKGIDKSYDDIDSELAISAKLITRFVKRIYTDRAIIAFTTLLVLGLAGIIVYATLNPGQTTFNVPDAAKPPSAWNMPRNIPHGSDLDLHTSSPKLPTRDPVNPYPRTRHTVTVVTPTRSPAATARLLRRF